MKILTIANEKGGVGKTLLTTQFAMYAALKFRLRVAVIDLDQQGNASKCLEACQYAVKANLPAVELLLGAECGIITDRFVYFEADKRLSMLEKQGDSAHGEFVDNLIKSLKSLEPSFDLVVIDTNPNPDIRSNAGLIVCTHLVSPIQLTKEPIDGIAALFERIEQLGSLNSNLPDGFLGMLPNMVESGSFQVENGKKLMEAFGQLLLKIKEIKPVFIKDGALIKPKLNEDGSAVCNNSISFGAIRRHAGIAEAQAYGKPIWEMESQKNAWAEMKRCFFAILEAMNIERKDESTAEMRTVLEEAKSIYGASWRAMIRQFWLSDNSSILIGLSPEKINLLRQLRGHISLSIIKE